MKSNTTKDRNLKNYLENTPFFKKVTFNHKDSVFSELKTDLGEDFSSVLESNPLLDSYDAYVKKICFLKRVRRNRRIYS